jgi:hypothetical protein
MGIEDYGGGQTERSDVLVVTTNDVPGFRVTQVIGEVFGLTVLPRVLGCARTGETPSAIWAARSAPG